MQIIIYSQTIEFVDFSKKALQRTSDNVHYKYANIRLSKPKSTYEFSFILHCFFTNHQHVCKPGEMKAIYYSFAKHGVQR